MYFLLMRYPMKLQASFFKQDESVIVTPFELKACLDDYFQSKQPISWDHPISKTVKKLSAFHDKLLTETNQYRVTRFNPEQLYFITYYLHQIVAEQKKSLKSYSAFRPLRNKLSDLIACIPNKEFFIFTLHNPRQYQILKPVVELLDRENTLLYNNIVRERYPDGSYGMMNISKNRIYKAQLNSPQNMAFIYKNPEHAMLIAEIFKMLHYGMIGCDKQEEAEYYIWNIKQNISKKLFLLKSSFETMRQNGELCKNNADLIVALCKFDDSAAIIPIQKAPAEEKSLAAKPPLEEKAAPPIEQSKEAPVNITLKDSPPAYEDNSAPKLSF